MRKYILLIFALLLSVGCMWAKIYTPGSRVTTLTNGTKYLIYNTSMGNSGSDDRTAFIGGGASSVSYYETKPAKFITSDVNNVWTLTIEDGKYYLQCGDGGKYAQGNSKDLSADKVEITIEDFLTSSYLPDGNVYSEKEDGTVIKLDKEDSSTGTGLFCIRKDGTCWNGNPSSFTTWSNGHPYTFYTVNEIDDDDATTAFNAINGYSMPDIQSYAQITSASQLYGSNSDSDEGQHIEYLIDFDNSTFYHTSWHSSSPATADDYIQIELPEALASFQFYYVPRSGASADWPSTIKIEGCNTADGEYTQIASVTDLPTTGGTQYYSSIITSGYKYLRVKCTANRTYWHMAEFNIYPGALVSNLQLTKPTFTASSTAAEIKAAYTDELKRVISNASNFNNLKTAVNKAKASGVAEATITTNDIYVANANYATSISTLNTAASSALTNNSVATVVAGKYRIINAKTAFNGGKALTSAAASNAYVGASSPGWEDVDADNPEQIWTFAAGSTAGTFTIKNEWNGMYITTAGSMTSTAKDATFTNIDSSNQYNITLAGDSNPLHANGHGWGVSSSNIVTWGGGIGEPSAWYLIPVTDDVELAAAQAKYVTAVIPEVSEDDKFTIEEGAQVVRASEIGNEPSVINAAIDAVLAAVNPSTATVRQLGAAYIGAGVVTTYKNALASVGKSLTNIVVTVKAKKFGTICLPCHGLKATDNFKVYMCSAVEGSTLTLDDYADNMVCNKPYIVKNESETDMKFQFIGWDYSTSDDLQSEGYLVGTYKEGGVTIPNGSYVLATRKSDGYQSFRMTDGTVTCPQYKCYLTVGGASSPLFLTFPDDDDLTGLEGFNIVIEDANAPIYDLQGRKVVNTVKGGIYIKNGKKFVAQ